MEQTVDVVFDFHDFVPVQRLQLPLQILQIDLLRTQRKISSIAHLLIKQLHRNYSRTKSTATNLHQKQLIPEARIVLGRVLLLMGKSKNNKSVYKLNLQKHYI